MQLTKNVRLFITLISILLMSKPAPAFFGPLQSFPFLESEAPDLGVEHINNEQPGLTSTDQVPDNDPVAAWIEKYGESEGLIELDSDLNWGNRPRYAGANDRRLVHRSKTAKQSPAAQVRSALTFVSKSASVCSQFITSSGSGSVGKRVMNDVDTAQLMMRGPNDLQTFCPKYPSLSDENQRKVWLLVMTVMSFLESSCNSSITAKGPNGTLRGLFQLHAGKEHQYTKSRRCQRNGSTTNDGSVVCTVGMLDDQMARASKLFSNDSYWGVLRPKGEPHPRKKGQRVMKTRVIQDALVALPLCH